MYLARPQSFSGPSFRRRLVPTADLRITAVGIGLFYVFDRGYCKQDGGRIRIDRHPIPPYTACVMFCPQCGDHLKPDERSCPKCRIEVKEEDKSLQQART